MVNADTINKVVEVIRTGYVDKDIAEKVSVEILTYTNSPIGKSRMSMDDPIHFINDINSIINVYSHDMHFSLNLVSGGASGISRITPHYVSLSELDSMREESNRSSYINMFKTIKDPLVLDLRSCRGGDANMVFFILCHFFPDGHHLFDLESRSGVQKFIVGSTVTHYQTFNNIVKFNGKLKVLISQYTYSGGEIIAKILQSHNRAKIYGSKTIGTVNATTKYRIDDIIINLPFGKFIDAASKKSFENIGVVPDYPVNSQEYITTMFSEVVENIFNPY